MRAIAKNRTLLGLGVRSGRGDGSGHGGLLRRGGRGVRSFISLAAGY